MNHCRQRTGMLSQAWLLALGSLLVMAGLVWLLWKAPADQPSRVESAGSRELTLFCAAGLMEPVREISDRYQQEYGVRIRIEPDASGPLLSKLRVAPTAADLYLAAEESFMHEAQSRKLVAEVIPAAHLRPTLAVRPGNPQKIAAVADLLREGVRVSLPNPELTAAGKAAQRVLATGGQWDALQRQSRQFQAKVSLVGTVNAAAQAVKVGAADAALVWDATARQFQLDAVDVAAFRDQPPESAMLGVVAATKDPTGALHFARYLTACDRGQPVFAKHYLTPIDDADHWADRPELTFMSGAMLKPAVDDLVNRFKQREGVEINTIYNGCGVHVAQMKAIQKGQLQGKHFPDAYFACDVSFMRMVQQWFEAAQTISRNDIVLVVAQGNPQKLHSLADLGRPELRVGLGHPTNSALGALTDDLLKKLGLHERVYAARPHPIVHTDAGHMLVNQMRTGALDAIVVYQSNVASAPQAARDALEVVPMNLPEAVAVQPYAVARQSQYRYLMRRLLAAILAPDSREHFIASGFQWVAPDPPR